MWRPGQTSTRSPTCHPSEVIRSPRMRPYPLPRRGVYTSDVRLILVPTSRGFTRNALHSEVENAGWMCQVDLFPVSRTEVSLSPPQYRNAVSPASSRHTNEYSPVNETSHLRPQYTYPPPLPTNPNSGDINSSSTTHRPTEPYNVGGNDGQRDLRSTPHSVMMANNSYVIASARIRIVTRPLTNCVLSFSTATPVQRTS